MWQVIIIIAEFKLFERFEIQCIVSVFEWLGGRVCECVFFVMNIANLYYSTFICAVSSCRYMVCPRKISAQFKKSKIMGLR